MVLQKKIKRLAGMRFQLDGTLRSQERFLDIAIGGA